LTAAANGSGDGNGIYSGNGVVPFGSISYIQNDTGIGVHPDAYFSLKFNDFSKIDSVLGDTTGRFVGFESKREHASPGIDTPYDSYCSFGIKQEGDFGAMTFRGSSTNDNDLIGLVQGQLLVYPQLFLYSNNSENNSTYTSIRMDGLTGSILLSSTNGLKIEGNTGLNIENSTFGYDQLILKNTYTPTSTSDSNGTKGNITWDDDYLYIKTSAGWKRSELKTF
jgi:hypothetical protein